jgi:hypothetical protein
MCSLRMRAQQTMRHAWPLCGCVCNVDMHCTQARVQERAFWNNMEQTLNNGPFSTGRGCPEICVRLSQSVSQSVCQHRTRMFGNTPEHRGHACVCVCLETSVSARIRHACICLCVCLSGSIRERPLGGMPALETRQRLSLSVNQSVRQPATPVGLSRVKANRRRGQSASAAA